MGNEYEIGILAREDEDLSRGDRVEFISKKLKVDELNERFKEFIIGLRGIIEIDEEETGPFQLEEIQFSAEISANGEFKLVGTGVGIEAGSGVTFVLKRKEKT